MYIVVGSSRPLKLCTKKLNISFTSDMNGRSVFVAEKNPIKGHGNTSMALVNQLKLCVIFIIYAVVLSTFLLIFLVIPRSEVIMKS
jgi:hypothetical protein